MRRAAMAQTMPMRLRWAALLVGMLWASGVQAAPPDRICSSGHAAAVQCIRLAHVSFDICQAIENLAQQHDLDAGFFARLIWQESRFDPFAISPANAQGIAQFIPSTADMRGLKDTFNPSESLAYSAQYLSELKRRFGNTGLAAIAYNGGENRAERFLNGTGGLPKETRDYVRIITGETAEVWRDVPPENPQFALQKDNAFLPACLQMSRGRKVSALQRSQPVRFAYGIQMAYGLTPAAAAQKFRKVTASCRGLVAEVPLEFIFTKNRASPIKGYYMARLGQSDRRSASQLCRELRRAGCVCAVFRNERP